MPACLLMDRFSKEILEMIRNLIPINLIRLTKNQFLEIMKFIVILPIRKLRYITLYLQPILQFKPVNRLQALLGLLLLDKLNFHS